jgi:gliding motility-associated protein GldE
MDITEPRWLEFLIQVVIVTFIILLFGEIMPKLYASLSPVRFALLMAYPLVFCRKIFHPLSSFLILSTSLVRKRLARKKHNISMEQLSDALDLASKDISDEKNILEGIVKFGNIEVTGIMKARIDVTAVEIQTRFSELIRIIIESGYSRIPVYSNSFDNIKGILYIKDLLPHLYKPDSFKWQSLIRPPYFVPENKKIDDLLREFQTKKIHMAVVVDEYGGTSGIITLEDILEEIVGEITDEADEDDITYRQIDNKTFIFEGKISLNDFYKITDLPDNFFDPVRGDADTLAGLILEIKGEFPKTGDKIKYNNLHFSIESVDRRRIRQIKMEIQS